MEQEKGYFARYNNVPEIPDDLPDNYSDLADVKSNEQIDSIKDNPKQGMKFDKEKPRFELVDLQDIEEEAIVMGIGAKKYDDYNYRKVPNAIGRYYSAMQRHINAWCNGEFLDQETGISHMIHVRCNAAILKWFEQNKPEMVDYWINHRKGRNISEEQNVKTTD